MAQARHEILGAAIGVRPGGVYTWRLGEGLARVNGSKHAVDDTNTFTDALKAILGLKRACIILENAQAWREDDRPGEHEPLGVLVQAIEGCERNGSTLVFLGPVFQIHPVFE
mgnify:FL=1